MSQSSPGPSGSSPSSGRTFHKEKKRVVLVDIVGATRIFSGMSDVEQAQFSACTFTLGSGPGIQVSERVYRKLPREVRGGWQKRKPPVTYVLEGDS